VTQLKTINKDISKLHFEHRLWSNHLRFHMDEIDIYEHRLEEIISRRKDYGVVNKVEELLNKFTEQREFALELIDDMQVHERSLAHQVRENPALLGSELIENHSDMESKVKVFKRAYKDLVKDFNLFMTEWM
jgi:hypothetical protein